MRHNNITDNVMEYVQSKEKRKTLDSFFAVFKTAKVSLFCYFKWKQEFDENKILKTLEVDVKNN